jgi:hypothetical protein
VSLAKHGPSLTPLVAARITESYVTSGGSSSELYKPLSEILERLTFGLDACEYLHWVGG